jgi:hypothetical protein
MRACLVLTRRQGEDAGLSKDELMLKADELGVSKDPMGGTGGWCAELHRGRVRGYGDNVLVIWLTLAAR